METDLDWLTKGAAGGLPWREALRQWLARLRRPAEEGGQEFDATARSLAEEVPRREAMRRLGAGLATAVLASPGLELAWGDLGAHNGPKRPKCAKGHSQALKGRSSKERHATEQGGEMKQTVRRLVQLGAIAVLLGSATTRPVQAQFVTSDLHIPISGTVFASNESVQFEALVHLVVRAVPPNPTVPPNPIRVHTNMESFSGVGQTSGRFYGASGAVNFDVAPSSSGDYPFSVGFRIVPPNPVVPPNPILPLQYLVTIAADGSVASANVSVGGGGDVDGGG